MCPLALSLMYSRGHYRLVHAHMMACIILWNPQLYKLTIGCSHQEVPYLIPCTMHRCHQAVRHTYTYIDVFVCRIDIHAVNSQQIPLSLISPRDIVLVFHTKKCISSIIYNTQAIMSCTLICELIYVYHMSINAHVQLADATWPPPPLGGGGRGDSHT